MCGICGIINFNHQPVDSAVVKAMMQKMKHRGPDDEGFFIEKNIGLGHVRLSIIDLTSAGHQPMISDDDRYVITYNGEIYNYLELKQELKNDFTFKTGTDTEVLLNAFRKWGKECLNKFNGMFSFVIYDKLTKELFGARDRFGVKPFYYYKSTDTFIFASDIPSILITKKYNPAVNKKITYDYLVFGRTDHSEDTFFKDIKKLQHGHCFTIKNGQFHLERWYKLQINIIEENKIDKVEKFLSLFIDSIKLRLRSDVPLGVCLSGGLDSSSIVGILKNKLNYNNISTFSAVYEKGERADESNYIELLKSYSKSFNYTKPTSDLFLEDMNDLIEAHSEPFSTSAIYSQYKVMQLAQGKVKVLLDGQGADEHLAGYHYFYGFYFKELFKSLSVIKLLNEVYTNIKFTRSLYGIKTALYFMLPAHIAESIMNSKKVFLSNEFLEQNKGSEIAESLYSSPDLNTALLNHFEYKLEHLLKWEDRNSMWFSLESRIPFLDYRLVEYMFSLPAESKINKGQTKSLLRESMANIIPDVIKNRTDKIGFATPESNWLRNKKFVNFNRDIINSKGNDSNIFNRKNLLKRYDDFVANKNNDSSDIWRIINYKLWYEKYFN